MRKSYQAVFVTHLPSFYKINLYNEIAKQLNILVVFVGPASEQRTDDFTNQEKNFDFITLNTTSFEQRNKVYSIFKCIKLMFAIKFKWLIIGGWDLPEFWAFSFLHSKKENALVLESSIFESQLQGVKKWIKKLFLSRISKTFYSGTPHKQLLEALGYKGKGLKTLGVGIPHYHCIENKNSGFCGKFLFVGRLSSEKNIELLLHTFQALPHYQLTLIGDGPLKPWINKIKPNNVKLLGHINFRDLPKYYQENNILILPSTKEPWGLVVEEALWYGLPVIASNKVGAALDLVQHNHAGVLFSAHSKKSLTKAIQYATDHFLTLKNNTKMIDFKQRDQHQVKLYTEALK